MTPERKPHTLKARSVWKLPAETLAAATGVTEDLVRSAIARRPSRSQ